MSNEQADLVEPLKAGKKFYKSYSNEFDTRYKLEGKTTKEWEAYFRVSVPEDPSPALCREIASKLIELYQEASSLKNQAESRYLSLNGIHKSKYRSAFVSTLDEYKSAGTKTPAKETMQLMAEEKVAQLEEAIVHAEIELTFWKEILSRLGVIRKLLEDNIMSLGIEAKAIQAEKYFDYSNSKQ